jgi:TRAP-type transport system small permease protein
VRGIAGIPTMNSLLSGWWRVITLIGNVERALGVLLMTTIVVTITVQVVTRYVFGQPLVWVEELAGYCFLWGVFLGAAVGMKDMRHIRVDTFVSKLPIRRQAFWRAGTWAIATVCCVIIAVQAWDIMDVESRSNTVALPIDLPRHLFYSTPMFVAALSIVFTGLYLVVAELALALTGRPVDARVARLARDLADREADAEADAIADRIAGAARAATAVRGEAAR